MINCVYYGFRLNDLERIIFHFRDDAPEREIEEFCSRLDEKNFIYDVEYDIRSGHKESVRIPVAHLCSGDEFRELNFIISTIDFNWLRNLSIWPLGYV